MTDLVMTVVFIVIALAIVVRTVFYAIEVIVNVKMTKKSLKLLNKITKAYEPLLDWCRDNLDKIVDI